MAVLGLDRRLMAGATARWMTLGVLAGVLGLVLSLLLMSIAGAVIDGAAAGQDALAAWWPALVALALGRGALGWLLRVATHRASQGTKLNVRDLIYRHALELGPGVLDKRRTGELVNLSVDGMEWLEQYYGTYFVHFVVGMATPVVLCVYIAAVDWVVALSLVAAIPLTPLFLGAMGKQFRRVSERYFALQSQLSAQFLDSLQGMPTLKMFNASRRRGRQMARDSEQLRVETMRLLLVNQVSIFLTDWGFALSTTVVMAVSGLMRLEAGALTPGQVVALLLISAEFARPLNLIGAFFFAGAIGREVANKIIAFLDTPPPRAAPGAAAPPRAVEPTLALSDVSFAYDGSSGPALDGVSFRVEARETVALVGPSGAGKSTVISLVMGFLAPQRGTIELGGVPVDQAPLWWVRSQLSLVSQDPYLFYGSVADNLRVARPDASQEELERACRDANLHDSVVAQPDGYDTLVGERGLSLSGGQAQRLAIARALLKDAPIVLLDEPTSQIDPETEAVISQALARLTARRTVLLIAHRLSTVERADRLVVLDRGRVVEQGTPAQLAARGGAYARMLAVQGAALQPAGEVSRREELSQ